MELLKWKQVATVVGETKNHAGVATKVAEWDSISMISQTVLDEYFMMAVVSSDEEKDFAASFRVRRIRSVSSCENQYPKALGDFDACTIYKIGLRIYGH